MMMIISYRPGLKTGVKKRLFGLNWGQGLENRVGHPHQEFPEVSPPDHGIATLFFSHLTLKSMDEILFGRTFA